MKNTEQPASPKKYIDRKAFHREFVGYLSKAPSTVARVANNVILDQNPSNNLRLITSIEQGSSKCGTISITPEMLEKLGEALGIPVTYTDVPPPKPSRFEKKPRAIRAVEKTGGHAIGGDKPSESE